MCQFTPVSSLNKDENLSRFERRNKHADRRETETETETERDRDRETERDRQTDRGRETERERQSETDRQRPYHSTQRTQTPNPVPLPSMPNWLVNCCSRWSPKGMASHGMQPTCCWNDSRLRSDVTKMTSNFRPVSFSRSYVFVSSGVKNLHGGHCRTEGETDAWSTPSAVFLLVMMLIKYFYTQYKGVR